ncbi:MAG TPA: Nramp family divalent metal transporter [Capsulimonadaceae bacterium]|nr:Nramp family divalent metal transporter [Capsulimonadaceae bacterium]
MATTKTPHEKQKRDQTGEHQKETKTGWLSSLGPGLITGASDDDPSGIATYSQVGAQYGYNILWTMLFSYPLMAAIQEISARIGRVTGRGISANIRRFYSPWLLYPIVLLMLIANTINLGADLGAMGDAVRLLAGGPRLVYTAIIAVLCMGAQTFIPYTRYAQFLKWLTLALFTYVGVVFVAHIPWGKALVGTIRPTIHFSSSYLTDMIAVLGTTISPYLFFWQASEEVEEERSEPTEMPLLRAPRQSRFQFHRILVDTYVGMGFSNLISFFIILTAAAVLHAHGVNSVQTASQAAEALRPIAGRFAFLLFGLGIIGTGLLAVPVLAGSAAYGVGEAMGWPVGLEHEPMRAKRFYLVLALATLVGLALNLIHIDPIKALFWTAVINGVVAVPVMVVMMIMTLNPKIMGQFVLPLRLKIMGWLSTAAMLAAAIGLFATWGK